jgi:hypothetical protein
MPVSAIANPTRDCASCTPRIYRTERYEAGGACLLKKYNISEVMLNVAAIFEWCNTEPLSEHIVHVCLAGEATRECDISQQHPGLS